MNIFYVRLMLGLIQAGLLYVLSHAYTDNVWPATSPGLFAPFVIISVFVPLIAIQSLGNLRLKTLGIWLVVATVTLAGISFYDVWHAWPVDWVQREKNDAHWVPHVTPSFQLCLFVAAGLFMSHALIIGADHDRKFIASYATHFDVAWKQGLQLILSIAFVLVIWALIYLGSALFNLIGLHFLEDLLQKAWFFIPVTTLAFSTALHITDVNASLIRGARTLALTLLSWLLPLLALLVTGFLLGLLFTGLEPLWKTNSASLLLLTASAALLILINAVYQDGEPDKTQPWLLRIVAMHSIVILIPLLALAGYGISLRVGQYGWTVDRLYVALCVLVGASYSCGYAIALFKQGAWLKFIEDWNFYMALLVLAIFLTILTPIADPMRISVVSQMARFESGQMTLHQIDLKQLRWQGGRYGKAALEELDAAQGTSDVNFSRSVKLIIAASNSYQDGVPSMTAEELGKIFVVFPSGKKLPSGFLKNGMTKELLDMSPCVRRFKCEAYVYDLDHDGIDEVLIAYEYRLQVYSRKDASGKIAANWNAQGGWDVPDSCMPKVLDGLKSGQNVFVPPLPQNLPDLLVSGLRFKYEPFEKYEPLICQP